MSTDAQHHISSRYSKVQLDVLQRGFKGLQSELELAINATPTGPVREKLTEANIHTMQVLDSLAAAQLELEMANAK